MKDKDKTNAQLLKEVTKLRRRIAELEKPETKRKEAEEALKESEEKFRSISTSDQDGIVMMDNEENITYWNKDAGRIFGYSKKEAIGKKVYIFLCPKKYYKAYKMGFSKLKKTGKYPVIGKTLEITAIRKDGKEFPIELTVSAVKIQGKWHSIGIVRNITDRKRAEETLQQSEERLKAFMELAPDSISLYDSELNLLDINKVGLNWFPAGTKKQNLKGKNMTEIEPYIKKIGRYDKYLEVVKTGKPFFIDDIVSRPKFSTKHLAVRAFKVGEGLGLISTDITERKKAEEELKETLIDLERSNKELEQFAYMVSHDLQEPLRIVASYVQLLERRYKTRLDSDADEFIDYAVDGANRMQRMIHDILAFSRVGTKGKKFKKTDCAHALDQATANLHGAIEESGAVVMNDDLPTIKADESQIVQLFQNLIDNAIKFRSKDPPHIHIGAKKKGKEWRFLVRDNGIGIEPQYAERIFVIFQRLHEKRKYPGTGIGLAICQRIVERHSGRIWVESEPGKGSTFFFTMPLRGGK